VTGEAIVAVRARAVDGLPAGFVKNDVSRQWAFLYA
jgi:hypothetical protein